MARVMVVGIGNVLNSDDGLGPFVARTLLGGFDFPADVDVVDAGTPGLDLVSMLHGVEAAVLVDAVRDAGAPGDVKRYDRTSILEGGARTTMSPHEPGLRAALLTMEFRGGGPTEVVLWGAIPEGVLSDLRRLGVEARPAPSPRDPQIWWERPED
jgi:hydrogenase maturation protease